MKFVFFDLETTGTNVEFDQILQFAAVLTDSALRELDRVELRCGLLPWIVPSPEALVVTRINPERLIADGLLTHYEMLTRLSATLRQWSPAIFVGYNSFQFDEEILRRALWQTLQFPWLTVSNGNGRLDLLQVLRVLALGAPRALRWPSNADGNVTFKLDKLAPANGYKSSNHHDAMSDALATLHLARKIASSAPGFWSTVISRSHRKTVEGVWEKKSPLLMLDRSPEPGLRFRQSVGPDPHRQGATLFARLDTDWESLARGTHADIRSAFERPQRPLVPRRSSRPPVFLTIDESEAFFGVKTSSMVQKQSVFLRENPRAFDRVLEVWEKIPVRTKASDQLEQQLYGGFPASADQRLATQFHRSFGAERAALVRAFKDQRLARWAQRILYSDFPDELSAKDTRLVENAIAERLLGKSEGPPEWRTVQSAMQELRGLNASSALVNEIAHFIQSIATRWEAAEAA